MAGTIGQVFKKLGKNKAFIPFITCGYPTMDGFEKLFLRLADHGADMIEVGLPFSDPLADGPVIQKTSQVALQKGMHADIMFESLRKLGKITQIPVVVMSYFNPIYRYGLKRFFSECNRSGISGLIVPDLLLEEYMGYKKFFEDADLDNIMMVSLTTGKERLKQIGKIGKGFVYCVSVKGVTGQTAHIAAEIKDFLSMVKKQTGLYTALGFGLSTVKQINDIKEYTDGIIIGSKILSLIGEDHFDQDLSKVEDFCRKITGCLRMSP